MNIKFTYLIIIAITSLLWSQNEFDTDTIKTASGDLRITFIKHGSLFFEFNQLVIHVDPVSKFADYGVLPSADIVLITHHHGDHLDPQAIELIVKDDTKIVHTAAASKKIMGKIMENGSEMIIKGIRIEAVPAYNLINKRQNGDFYHPKGVGNGYVLTFENIRIYIAGDTENVPEMANLMNIDFAFLPMNLPYTMTPSMVNKAARMINAKVLYPYHFGDSNLQVLQDLLQDKKDLEIRIRKMN